MKRITKTPGCTVLSIAIPGDSAAIWRVRAGVNELLTSRQWPDEEIMKVELAVQEALENAVRHGCKNDPGKQVQCWGIFNAEGEFVMVVRDPGPGFDPAAVPNPLEVENLLKPSGRGVFMIKQLMDTVEFAEGGRLVVMRKRRDSTRAIASGAAANLLNHRTATGATVEPVAP
jgi:serine/threonine-protein kinase RsbW